MAASNGSCAGGYGPPWARGERRKQLRRSSGQPIACHATACPAGADWWEVAVVRDISCSGLGLALSRQLAPGSVIVAGSADQPRYLAARVVHVARQEAYWLAGCQLLTELSAAELRLWW